MSALSRMLAEWALWTLWTLWTLSTLTLPVAAASQADRAPEPPLSIAEYVAGLDRLISATKELQAHPEQLFDLVRQIPPRWQVHAEQRTFTISAEPLRRDLREWRADHNRAGLDRLSVTLQSLRSDAVAFQEPLADVSRERARLTGILSGREFHGIHGPTALDYLRQRVQRFFLWLLGRAFRSSAIPTVSRLLVDLLIGLAVLMLAYWMYRTIRGAAALETNFPSPLPRSAQEWAAWLEEARAAANNGRWRDAVHLAYWCGIAFMEAQGVWRPDRARTPREYLRLLPPASEHLPTLTALTRGFELVWYGTQDADADAFARAMAELKKLGCPSN